MKKYKKTSSEKIVEFLNSHPLISLHGLEKLCSLPQATFYKAAIGTRKIPERHISGIEKILRKYGY